MKMNQVVSSNVKAIGYDIEEELLVVEFLKGTRYEYKNVPAEVYKILLNAESVGKAFHRYVRSQNYKYKKVG